MTKQTKSLGGLADIQASPPPTPETTDQRVDQLERRLTQAEVLLNDVMQQLDQTVQGPTAMSTGNRMATRILNRRIR